MPRFALLTAGALVVLIGTTASCGLAGPDDSPASATKEAIAAVTVDVLDIEPSSYEVNPLWDVPEPLGVEIRWHPGGDSDAHYLHVDVEETPDEKHGCSPNDDHCASWAGDDGRFRLTWQEEQPEEDPGILTLYYETDTGETRSVTYAGEELNGDPREQSDLPVSIDRFADLLTDPRFSATTTQEMVDTDLSKWPDDDTLGDPVPTTPQVVAQWLLEDGISTPADGGHPADVSRYAEGTVGVELRSPDRTTTVVLVPKDADEVPTCGAGWHCRTSRSWAGQVVTGWRPGEALTIRRSDDAVVYGTVRSEAIDQLPRPSWKFGKAGRDFEALVRAFSSSNLVTTQGYAQGRGPRWFHDDQG